MKRTAEEYRLISQGRKRDRISTTYSSLKQLLPSYLDTLLKFPYSFKIKIRVLFDKRSTKRPQGKTYEKYLINSFSGKDCPVSSKEVGTNIFLVNFEKYFRKDKSYLKELLYQGFKPRSFQFSEACSMIPVDQNNEPIPNLSLFYSDSRYLKYLPKVHGATIFPSPKEPYIGRSTIFANLTYYSGTEKELITKLLLQIVDLQLNMGLRQTLNAECKDRLIGYEKVLPPGKEIRQHWRVMVNNKYVYARYHHEIFKQMIMNDDAFAFYPSVKQTVEFQGKELDVQSRFVVEVDPRTSSIEYAGKVYDVLTEVTERFELPIRRFHSGSRSARIHLDIDAEDVLHGTSYLLDKYSFIGSGLKKRGGNIEIDYWAVMRALKDAIFVNTWNYLYKEHPPRITKNKFSCDNNIALIDFPGVSIAGGSPKKIVRLNAKKRKILERVNQDNPNWSNWSNLPFMINVCTPLRDNEEAPKSHEEILALCNVLFAAERFNQEVPVLNQKIKKKITTNHIETVLKRIPKNQLVNLNALSEERYGERYP